MTKNKIGARCLSENEVKLILPTYGQIYNQIEQFREEATIDKEENTQKTNNIGILGVRGAGKTSVLKTIREKLRVENKNGDIILPIIIPENMSEPSTLMATILGMLGDIVKQQTKNGKAQKNGDTECIKKNELDKKYEAAVRQYTFIQKEYRDLLIQEYSTESDYVKDSAKVFNSDTEFITKFNELIRALTTMNREKKDLFLYLLMILI